jgi:hypothetical protein
MQAIFNDATINGESVIFSITYIRNNGQKVIKEYVASKDITPTYLTSIALDEINNFVQAQQRKQSITVAPGSNIDLTPPNPPQDPVPTQDQLDMQAYYNAKQQVIVMSRLIDLGSDKITPTTLASAVKTWNALPFNPAWESLG